MLAQDPNQAVMTIVGILLGSFGIPLGIPPDKEDELLARVAPPTCVYYSSTAGMAAIDPSSPNSTDKLLASPEVKKALALIESGFEKVVAQVESRQGPQAAALARESWKRAKFLLTRPNALWVESFRLQMNAEGTPVPVDLKGALLVNLGPEQGPPLRDLFAQATKELGESQEVTIGNYKFQRVAASATLPATLTWGLLGQYFVIGLGDRTVEELVARGRNQPPAWLTKIRSELPIPRRATLAYLNVAELRKILAPVTQEAERPFLEALGLESITAFESTTGLDADGFISKVRLATSGPPGGVLKVLEGSPITPADLVDVPDDATAAIVLKVDANKAVDLAISIADKLKPGAGTRAALQATAGIQLQVGVNVREDLVKALGATWRVYSAPGDGALVYPGLTVVVDLQDAAKFAAAIDKFVAKFQQETAGREGAPTLTKGPSPLAGVEMTTLTIPDAPVAPAWAIVGNKLVVAATSVTLKNFLRRDASFASLAKNPKLGALLGEQPGRGFLVHLNLAQIVESYGPLAQGLLQRALLESFEDLDPSAIPQLTNLAEYLLPQWNTARYTAAGIEFETRSTLPSSNVVQSIPVQAAILLPAIDAARDAARRTQEANNLKQIALAMHNYHAVHNAFPPAYTVDKNGKPLHSWRVLILPYLEQDALYRQLKLDEPWDSEHNKPLLSGIVIPTYQSPSSDGATETKTRFLTVRSDASIFPGKEKMRIDAVTDGTSNTLLVLQVAPEAAVEWYRPDDFVLDAKDATARVFHRGKRSPYSVFAFADGSVHVMTPEELDAVTLKALITRNGGEAVRLP